MATNYPSGLDSLSNPAGTDALSTGHAAQHGNANDAIEAIEGELGLNPRGGSATVKARFDAIEANGWVTNARVADNTVTDAKLNQGWVTFSDASVVCAATTRKLAQTGTMSASRSVTLPAANAVSAGTEIVVADASGSVTSTNTIVVTRAGADTINGAASVSIAAAYGWRRLVSDGSSKWAVDGGVVRLSDVGTVTSTMIADATIVGGDIATGTVTSTNIADATITGTDIASGTVTSANITDATIVGGDIASGTITSTNILDGTITGTDIASGTVTSTNILDATILNADLADGAISPIKTSGGYVAKTALYTATNDDRVIDCTTGTYTITLPTAASQTGRTFIIRNSGSGTITIGRTGAETISGATSQTLAGYGSLDVISNGTNWLVLRGTYTDETVGRRIFTWDTVNSRWQMTYGDTGLRSLTLTPNAPCSTLTVELRRVNNLCHIDVVWVSGAITLPQADFSLSDTALPSGFTPTRIMRGISWSNYLGNAAGVIYLSTLTLKSSAAAGSMAAGGGSTQQRAWTYSTTDAWPTSLPGSAVGSIPST